MADIHHGLRNMRMFRGTLSTSTVTGEFPSTSPLLVQPRLRSSLFKQPHLMEAELPSLQLQRITYGQAGPTVGDAAAVFPDVFVVLVVFVNYDHIHQQQRTRGV